VRLRPGARTRDVLERLRPVLATFPAGAVAVEAGRSTALGRLLGGGSADLAVRIEGEDVERALAYARTVETRLARLPTLENVRVGTAVGQPELRLEIDRERAAAFGIEPRAIARTIETFIHGAVATHYVDFDRLVPVVVRLPEEARRSLAVLDRLRVDGVPLRELVRAREALAPVEILRVDQRRIVPVYADVREGGLETALATVHAALRDAPPPAGVRVEVGGENEEMRRSFRSLALAFGLAVLLVYMILAAEFESLVQPAIVLLSVPLALVGGIAALWIAGAGLNAISLIGFIVLVGIVDNDAVVKIDFINQARRRGLGVREAILEAGRARLRPIVMNTLTAMLGLLPVAVGIGPGAELQAPMAIALFGGLFTATALTLVVVPVAYERIEHARAGLARRIRLGPRRAQPAPARPEAAAPAPR